MKYRQARGAVLATAFALSPAVALAEDTASLSGTAPVTSSTPAAQPTAKRLPAGAIEVTAELLAENATRPVPALIATSLFATRPFLTEPRLSPDGRNFAARSTSKGQTVLLVGDVTGATPPRLYGFDKKTELVRYFWAGNDTLLFSFGRTVPWFDDEAYSTRLYAIDIATGKRKFIGGSEEGLTGDDVLWVDPDGKSLLLAYQPTIYDLPAVYRIDLATNRSTKVAGPFDHIWDWYADKSGVVRYGYGWTDRHHWRMVYRKDASQPFRIVATGTDKDDEESAMAADKAFQIAAGSDTGFAYGTQPETGLTAIYRYDFSTHQRGELAFSVPGNDVSGARTSDDGTALYSAAYTDDRDRIKWWDPTMQAAQTDIDNAVGADREAWITSTSRDHRMMTVLVLGSNDPGRHYLYQRAAGVMSVIAHVNERLPRRDLAVTRYVHYTARDGTEIPAYLTLPVGRPAKGLPLIVMPHGGPFGVRDHGDYNADVQFLANRGYVVLQPQFRGSESYGKAFVEKAVGQWGRTMQDDLDDGMDWLVKSHIVDAGRACIVGSSYGGYAAIWGATRNPERYRCAVSFAGISDLERQLRYQMNSFSQKQASEKWREKVQGDAGFDLKSVSGLYTIDRLKVPIMLVHGDEDQIVPVKQSRLYVKAMAAAGKTYEYYELPDEIHGLSSEVNAKTWYDRLDAFLAKYNPAR